MQAKAFNPQVFLEFLCYCVFGGLILYLVKSGKYLSYVTPRMEPYLYFTVIVMGIWALAGLGRLFRPQYKIRSSHCYVLAIPILLLSFPHSPLSISDLSGNYVSGNTLSSVPNVAPAESITGPTDDSSSYSENDFSSSDSAAMDSIDPSLSDTQTGILEEEDGYTTNLPGLDTANKKITVSNDNFSMWLTVLYDNIEEYNGYTIIMTGYIFNDSESLQKDEFVLARLMMSCCAADLSPAGLICKYDKASALEAGSWVTIEGTIFIGQYEYDGEKYDDPQISVAKITPTKEVEGYIYPFY
ncbi:MAG TPA: TIGR03943 family protein [Clostridiales bacterium]|nr:TIGR03943 family protein [Clostridiales bacterium]